MILDSGPKHHLALHQKVISFLLSSPYLHRHKFPFIVLYVLLMENEWTSPIEPKSFEFNTIILKIWYGSWWNSFKFWSDLIVQEKAYNFDEVPNIGLE